MRPQGQKSTPSRLRSLAWLRPWVMTHLLGTTDGSAFLQGGLPHCVFSPDLPDECSRSVKGIRPEHGGHPPNRLLTSLERGIAFYPAMRSQIL